MPKAQPPTPLTGELNKLAARTICIIKIKKEILNTIQLPL